MIGHAEASPRLRTISFSLNSPQLDAISRLPYQHLKQASLFASAISHSSIGREAFGWRGHRFISPRSLAPRRATALLLFHALAQLNPAFASPSLVLGLQYSSIFSLTHHPHKSAKMGLTEIRTAGKVDLKKPADTQNVLHVRHTSLRLLILGHVG